MINRTFHKTEELVDLKNKRVKISDIAKYCKSLEHWNGLSKDIKHEVVNKIIEDFESKGYEVDLEN